LVKTGVLALQGDWAAHTAVLQGLGANVQAVRTAAELAEVRSLVIPGGESSTMLRLMEPEGLSDRIVERVRAGMAVLATCAGVILLARGVVPTQPSLGLLAIDVERNAYGRQLYSTVASIELSPELGQPEQMEAVFIRAPKILSTGDNVEVLATLDAKGRVIQAIGASAFRPGASFETRRLVEAVSGDGASVHRIGDDGSIEEIYPDAAFSLPTPPLCACFMN